MATYGDVEYEFGNSPSGDGSDTDMASPRRGAEGERVVMMYDEDGNAVPMPMGNFYYDTYNPGEESSEEDELKRSSDTERSNKPAALSMEGSDSDSDTEESYTDDVEEEEEEDDQFMRIQVAAAPLKAASTVEQDVDHDKEKPKPKFGGMTRHLSSVKVGGGAFGTGSDRHRGDSQNSNSQLNAREKAAQARAAATKAGAGRQGISAVGRMLSFTKEKKQEQQPQRRNAATASGGSHGDASDREEDQGQDRPRGTGRSVGGPMKSQKRQGIAAVGRMLSLKKTRDEKPSSQKSESSPSARSSTAEGGNVPISQSRDSPKREKLSNQTSGRQGIAQVGRMMSLSKRVPTEADLAREAEQGSQLGNRERRETEKTSGGPGGRAGIKQVGRMMSMSKRSPGQQAPRNAGKDIESNVPSPQGDRERQVEKPQANPRKDGARASLKAAGRLLSFSRKPTNPAENGGESSVDKNGQNGPSAPIRIQPPTSPRLDGRANKFFFSEINSAAIKNSATLQGETHIRIPVLVLAEYSGPVSKNKWFIDAFTLPHNAVRRECIDLYDILMALARCRPEADISKDDMKDFHAWWTIAEKFIKCYFEMEREVLFPWVDLAGSKDWELQMALSKMRAMKDGLQEQLESVNKAWDLAGSVSIGELFSSIYKAVDIFCPRIMNYFADQELLLPQIVKGYYRIDDRLAMDKDMLTIFMGAPLTRKNKDRPHHNLVLLIRWIANPRQLRAWIGKNLNSTGRNSYSKWHTLYENEHARYVKSFRNRSRVGTIAAMAR